MIRTRGERDGPERTFARRGRGLVAFVAMSLAGSACWPGCTPAPPRAPNVVLVLIDTLRQDHLGCYGYPRDTTPFIDALASRGLLFERAVAQAPWTGASMASLWTSRYPPEAGGMVLPDAQGIAHLGSSPQTGLDPRWPTLAEKLSQAGYRTLAAVANRFAGSSFGMLRGFEVRLERNLPANDLVDLAIARLDGARADSPFFLYLHLLDLHEPIDPPPPHAQRFPADDGRPHEAMHQRWRHGRTPDPDASEVQTFRSHKIALYDGALHFVDSQLSRLAGWLDAKGLNEATIWVVASDHGEAFWDHARVERRLHLDPRGVAGIGHGHSLFAELTDVPLVFAGPGVPQGRVTSVVRNLDVMPTLLGLVGITTAGEGMRGVDLRAHLGGGETQDLPAFSSGIAYGPEARSLQLGRYKLVRYERTRNGTRELLFDRERDPREHADLRQHRAEPAIGLGRALDDLLNAMSGQSAPAVELDDETRDALRAIGYVE